MLKAAWNLSGLLVRSKIIESLSICTKLLSHSDDKLNISMCLRRAARCDITNICSFRAATSHWALLAAPISERFFHLIRAPSCVFSLSSNPDLKETWYWDSSNVTDMVLSGVKCTGDEMSLSQCQHHKTVSCQKAAAKFAAGVICSESEWTTTCTFYAPLCHLPRFEGEKTRALLLRQWRVLISINLRKKINIHSLYY